MGGRWRVWGDSGVWTAGRGSTLVTWPQRTSDATHQHSPVGGDEAPLLRASHHLGCDAVLHAAQGSQGVGVDGVRPSCPAESTRMHTARHAWGRRPAREWRPGTAAARGLPTDRPFAGLQVLQLANNLRKAWDRQLLQADLRPVAGVEGGGCPLAPTLVEDRAQRLACPMQSLTNGVRPMIAVASG